MPLGDHPGAPWLGAIEYLALAVAFVEGDDRIGGAIGEQADTLEEADPQATDVADLGIQSGTQLLVGVLRDPVGLGQVDLALLGVDAVLAEQVAAAPATLQDAAQQAGVAGGDRVQHARPRHPPGRLGEHEHRRLHRAQGPEVIDEGRIGAIALVACGDRLPTGLAVEKVLAADAALGEQVEQRVALLHVRRLRVVEETVQIAQRLFGLATALSRLRVRRTPGGFQEVFLDVQHIVRDRVVALAVGILLAADEEHREGQVGETEDQLVDPAGDAAADIGPGALQQQADIGDGRRRSGVFGHVQYLARAAKGGRCSMSSGIPARSRGMSR